jgi:hypothetical protein
MAHSLRRPAGEQVVPQRRILTPGTGQDAELVYQRLPVVVANAPSADVICS